MNLINELDSIESLAIKEGNINFFNISYFYLYIGLNSLSHIASLVKFIRVRTASWKSFNPLFRN